MAKILLVDDDVNFISATREVLSLLGHTAICAHTMAEAIAELSIHSFTHCFLDLILPDGSGFHLLQQVSDRNPHAQVIFITGQDSIKGIAKQILGNDVCYLTKPITVNQLESLLTTPAPSETSIRKYFGCLVGESDVMQQMYETIRRISTADVNVLLQGESGSGKEMVAQAIHNASQPQGEWVATNCGALSRELIGSELFGHEKGAFTGAHQRKIGVFEQADQGTLFLDEVTEMPIDLQPTLLRALETRQIIRLGSQTSVRAECRVISATNRSEEEIVEKNLLREDVYFRLAVFPIKIPPLRVRKDDIPLLVEYFMQGFNIQYKADNTVDEQQINRLVAYDWPGNVRELRHLLHRAFIMADPASRLITLPEVFGSPFSKQDQRQPAFVQAGRKIEEVEKELIDATLKHFKGDKKLAADMLGISLKTLYNRLNAYQNGGAILDEQSEVDARHS